MTQNQELNLKRRRNKTLFNRDTYGVHGSGIPKPGVVHLLHVGGGAAVGKRFGSCGVVGAHSGRCSYLGHLPKIGDSLVGVFFGVMVISTKLTC